MQNLKNTENWKYIEGYEGKYQVSDQGRVKSLYIKEPLILAQNMVRGYPAVSCWKSNKGKKIYVHRLVCNAFLPNPENKGDVNHINGIKTDNRLVNLEWMTRKENIQHAYNTGLNKQLSGINNSTSKIKNKKDIDDIRILYKTGCYTQQYLGNMYNISGRGISEIVNFKTYQ